MEFKIEKRLPTVHEYNNLRQSAGWPTYEESLAAKGIANSLFSVCVTHANKFIGFGRVIGDGAIYLHIQDVIVHPEYQKKGIGKMIMKELLTYVDLVAGKNTNIGLMCSKGREKFYADLGFTARPNDKFGAGMICIKN
jgi:ribosomal protein S18 acetylase RimI-like enzyme